MPNDRYLLIDSATRITQVIVLEGGRIVSERSAEGNAVENISSLTKDICNSAKYSFDDFDGMVFCSGPGSALGLRAALISIKTWMVFSKKNSKLLEYCSLDMCERLNPDAESIFTYGVGDNIVSLDNDGTVHIAQYDAFQMSENALILNTRHTVSEKFKNFKEANYNISEDKFPILSICKPSNGELKDYGSNVYKKWSPEIKSEKR